MTKTNVLKAKAVTLALLLFSFGAYSQNCEVDKETLKGTYTGDCKKNKAHGKGKAVGTDTYEGEFKNGIPDGNGTYTWSNKNVFEGKYVKGLREGKGTMTFKKEGTQDSVVEGFWKKDVYIGKNEKPWQVISKTGSVTKVDVEYTPDVVRRIKVIVTNTTGGVSSIGGQMPNFRVDNVVVVKGFFERMTSLETHFKSTETSLMEVTFPFRGKFMINREEIEIEFFEAGSYTVNIAINN
jgi:hypothetical protein